MTVLMVLGLACEIEETTSGSSAESQAQSTSSSAPKPTSAPEPTSTPEPTLKVELGEIIALADSNNVAADKEYKGKLIEVTGIISEVEADYILVQQLDRDEFLEMNGAKCNLHKDETSKVLALREEQTATVSGRVSGFGTTFGIEVKMKDCRLLAVDGKEPIILTGERVEDPPGTVTDVLLGDVIALVESNNVAADWEYKGKVVKFKGIISEIEADYILVQQLDRDEFLEMNDAKCDLASDEKDKVVDLRADQNVTVSGEIKGFGTTFGVRVNVKDCKLLD
jgi:hypothetical protein